MSATISLDLRRGRKHDASELDFHVDPFAGQHLDHFHLDERLGRGGMGSVYRALDTSLQRYVAVKVLHPKSNDEPETEVHRVLQEAITQARLNHPNVVTIYYVGRDEERPFFAMELLDGFTLQEALRNGPLPLTDILAMTNQIVSALEHATRYGIVHGDIKPANLLRTVEGTIKLSDFGLASFVMDGERSSSLSGTPNYLAPEMLDGAPNSVQSDMYALGVTLFELTFGKLPFLLRGATLRERLETHKTAEIEFPEPWPKAMPLAWKGILRRLLSKSPDSRYSTYQELREDLERLQPLGATPAGFPVRLLAYGIDQFGLLLPIVGLALWARANQTYPDDTTSSWVTPFACLLLMLVPLGLLAFIWWDIRTPGRWLSQLRVVDRFGLPLDRSKRVTREFLRNIPMWMLIFSIVLELGGFGWLTIPVNIGTVFFMLADFASMFFGKQRRTLHDYSCDSKVVLAANT